MMGIEELRAAWNAQADQYNQWDDLGLDEIVAFAQEVEREQARHDAADTEAERMRNALAELARYFTSSNSVPVERATILAKDFWRITALTPNASFSREPERSGGESAGSVCWAPTLEIGMTPVDLIADLRSRINPAYANQIGTESWERKLCADALEEQASAIDLLHSWESDANARASLLEQHLRAVLEVALTWQPAYATKMDRDTLQYAQECADGKVPNVANQPQP